MNSEEKFIIRIIFKKKMLEANGQSFENIFTEIMQYREKNFLQVRPWGQDGDRKNDGYIPLKKRYYQVYAPLDPENKFCEAVRKAKNDFEELIKNWEVEEYFFVFNDKYIGAPPQLLEILDDIRSTYFLNDSGVIVCKDLEHYLYELEDDQIFSILGYIPKLEDISNLEFEILHEVVNHLMKYNSSQKENIKAPDWDDKLIFNGLNGTPAEKYLEAGVCLLEELEEYLNNNSDFTSEHIRGKINQIYIDKKKYFQGLKLFEEIVDELIPRPETKYWNAVCAIMSKYFISCDVFEDPPNDR
ncbi:ABC-three component system protein [Deferribacter abyssi]|uniref:ABC-three component system protein n=1 Tax=Deferribacter abyssi TaxID=213806 RepID=UPI003C1B960C